MRTRRAVVAALAALLLGGPALAKEKRSPKKVVAVTSFQVTTAEYADGEEPWTRDQLGQGMRAMLADALVKTGKFIVVERGEGLEEVAAEQALKAVATRGSGAEAGQAMAAQAIFRGEITDFTPGQQTAKASTGGLRIGGVTLGSVGVGVRNASVASVVRWIDTSSGEVLGGAQAEAKATSVGFDVSGYAGVPFGTEAYTKTPIGRATSDVIRDTVAKIVAAMERVPFQCKVVRGTRQEVYLNVGSQSGLEVGDRLDVFALGEALVDPDSGARLGAERSRLGTVQVTKVQPKYSVARFQGLALSEPKPGDVAQEPSSTHE